MQSNLIGGKLYQMAHNVIFHDIFDISLGNRDISNNRALFLNKSLIILIYISIESNLEAKEDS